MARLEELAKKYCIITGRNKPRIENKIIFTCAGDHGVAAEQVSAYPKEVTAQYSVTILRGNAAVNVLARHASARVVVIDMGVDHVFDAAEVEIRKIERGHPEYGYRSGHDAAGGGTVNLRHRAGGIIPEGAGHLGLGGLGIANTTSASAIVSVLTNAPVEHVVGRGTGIDDKTLARKTAVITQSLALNIPDRNDPIDVLEKVGGYEIGCIAGLVLGAALHRIPVVLDGFVSTAGALIAAGLNPLVKEYIIAAHESIEMGHRNMLEHLEQVPLFDLNLRVGEGSGAALGISFVEAGLRILSEMATFASAGVAERNNESITS